MAALPCCREHRRKKAAGGAECRERRGVLHDGERRRQADECEHERERER